MSEALDMSLDDIIKNNKKYGGPSGNFTDRARGRGRGRGRGTGSGPARRIPNRTSTRTKPYLSPQLAQVQELVRVGGANPEAGTKLYVSNLDYGVSNEDIEVLFSEVGVLKSQSINYDRSGRSKGTAEVVFARRSDAIQAMTRYSNVELDGKPMKIEMFGNLDAPAAMPSTTNGILGNRPAGTFRSRQERGSGGGRDRGGRGFGRGRGRGGAGHGEKISAKDLDADLEKYHMEAMELN